MRMPVAFAGVLGAALLLSACSAGQLRTFATVDATDKTVTVPPGGGLTGALKEALAQDGWRLQVYRGPEVTRGSVGETTKLERFDSFNTRYNLIVRWAQFDICIPMFDAAYNYDLALIDNKTGSEVLTLSGRGCEGRIVNKFMDAVRTPGR